MNIRFLETFIWAAKLRSFKAVANKLNISQATVSGRIATLEAELQHALFQRNYKEVTLTEAGQRVLPQAQAIVNTERLMHETIGRPRVLSGLVRLGIVESVLHTWFPSFIQKLQGSYSDIEIEVTVESTRRLHDLISRGGLDLALQTDPIVGNHIHNRELGSLKMGWFSDHSIQANYLSAAELLAHPIITFTRDSQPHMHVKNLIESTGHKGTRLHFVSSITASHRLIEAGIGIATLPTASITDDMLQQGYKQIYSECYLPALKQVASWRADPIEGLAQAVVSLALEEMRLFADAYPQHATPPLKSTSFLR